LILFVNAEEQSLTGNVSYVTSTSDGGHQQLDIRVDENIWQPAELHPGCIDSKQTASQTENSCNVNDPPEQQL
jgi:hypothetical protein